jgi:hypothetical protein
MKMEDRIADVVDEMPPADMVAVRKFKCKNNSEKPEVKHLKENKMYVFSIAKLFFCFTGSGIHMNAMRATF